jgi:HAD superfamily hydrolase (TIGR01549 family)
MKPDRIDTVLFDLDDTLHDDSAAYKAAAKRVADDVAADRGIDADRLLAAYIAEANGFWKKLSTEHLTTAIHDTRAQLWYDALVAAGIDDLALARICAERYNAYRAEVLALSPGALDLLIALRERGCKIGIVSNGFAATHHDKIDRLALRAHIDALFLADEMGMVKPDPRVFTHACAVLGSVPERSAMVGDRYDRDITGAHEAGLFTVLIDVHAIPIPDGAVPPDAVVATIGDVLAVLPLDRQEASVAAPNRSTAEQPASA